MKKEDRATRVVRKTYNRVSPIYDFMESLVEMSRYKKWREILWSKVQGTKILEVGVGTGKNFPYYPAEVEITAIDFSDKVLSRARDKAKKQRVKVNLQQMDVQNMSFEDNTFDTVIGSFVFCSVPDPAIGLKEVRRVCKTSGEVVLLEHVLSANRLLGWLMNLVNPIVVTIMGPNINRRTVENVSRSGLVVDKVTDLALGIFKLIEARKQNRAS